MTGRRTAASVSSCAVVLITEERFGPRLETLDDCDVPASGVRLERLLRDKNEESRQRRTTVWNSRDSSLADVSSRDRGYGVGVAAVSSGVAIPSGMAIV